MYIICLYYLFLSFSFTRLIFLFIFHPFYLQPPTHLYLSLSFSIYLSLSLALFLTNVFCSLKNRDMSLSQPRASGCIDYYMWQLPLPGPAPPRLLPVPFPPSFPSPSRLPSQPLPTLHFDARYEYRSDLGHWLKRDWSTQGGGRGARRGRRGGRRWKGRRHRSGWGRGGGGCRLIFVCIWVWVRVHVCTYIRQSVQLFTHFYDFWMPHTVLVTASLGLFDVKLIIPLTKFYAGSKSLATYFICK